ncbi:MAG: hypothetical protein ACTHN5_11335 [Phycisphaerae bacterium]
MEFIRMVQPEIQIQHVGRDSAGDGTEIWCVVEELSDGDHATAWYVLARDVYFEESGWEGVPTVTVNTPITIQAFFTQDGRGIIPDPDPENVAREKAAGVWFGSVESAPLRTTLWVN